MNRELSTWHTLACLEELTDCDLQRKTKYETGGKGSCQKRSTLDLHMGLTWAQGAREDHHCDEAANTVFFLLFYNTWQHFDG